MTYGFGSKCAVNAPRRLSGDFSLGRAGAYQRFKLVTFLWARLGLVRIPYVFAPVTVSKTGIFRLSEKASKLSNNLSK